MTKFIIGEAKTEIVISESKSRAKKTVPENSYVTFTIKHHGVKTVLFLAAKMYAESPDTRDFYQKLEIGGNVDLRLIPHGTAEDTKANTFPKFLKAANQIRDLLVNNNTVLVNCNNGRSRSGTVIALYFMIHLNFSAHDAIRVVTAAIEKRGFKNGGIDLKNPLDDSYGNWLRAYETQLNKENSADGDEENNKSGATSPARSPAKAAFFQPQPQPQPQQQPQPKSQSNKKRRVEFTNGPLNENAPQNQMIQ